MADTLVYVVLLLPMLLAICGIVRGVARGAGGRSDRRVTPPPPSEVAERWLPLVGVNLLVFFLASSVAVAGLESYYRFFYDSTDSFGLTRTTQEWWMRHSRANKAGVRDNIEYSFKRTPGTPRITFLGDSFSAGHGVANVDARFPNLIRKERPAWEVHALAKTGLDTGAEIRLLQDVVRRGYELDRVLLVYCLNDIADIVPEWNAIIDRIKDKRDPPGFLVQHSYLANILYYRLKAVRDPDVSNYYGFVRTAYDGKVWEAHRRRLVQLKELVEANGAQLMVATFPFLHAIGTDYEFRAIHEMLDDFWKGLGVPYLDLLPVYARLSSRMLTVNRFDAHPNERAHRLAATAIEEFLDRHVQPGA